MQTSKIAIVVAAGAMFWAGRTFGSSSGDSAATRAPTAAARAASRADIAAEHHRTADLAALGPALDVARARANSPVGGEVRATIHESAPHREARHQYLASETERLYPRLPAEKRAQMTALSDRNDAQFRAERAAFMLGDISEDEYTAALKQMVRDGVEEAKGFLSREEFIALEGNPDADPFDVRGQEPVNGHAPYLSRGEAEAAERDRGPDDPSDKL